MYGFNGNENEIFAKHIHEAIEAAKAEIYDSVDPDGIDLGMFKDILGQWADEIHRGVNFVIYGTKQEDDDHLEEPYVDAEFVDKDDEFEIYNGYQE
jgi:hypothetical protein